MAKRLKALGQPNYANGFQVTLHEHMLERPLQWKKPQMIFVNSMSDLFHKEVSFDFILTFIQPGTDQLPRPLPAPTAPTLRPTRPAPAGSRIGRN
jgi:protein gp37